MLGATAAMVAQAKRDQFEASRTKWVYKNDDGEEFLMVHCQCCGQPWARQKVARFSEESIREWRKLKKTMRLSRLDGLVPMAVGIVSILLGHFYVSFVVAVAFYILLVVIFVAYAVQRDAKIKKRWEEGTGRILEKEHCSVPLERLGLEGDYNCNVIIMPKE